MEEEMKLKEKLCAGVSLSEEDDYQKLEKVVAPFLQTLKKRKHEKADVLPSAYEELYLKRNPKELFARLESAFADPLQLKTIMNETAELLKVVTKSKSVNLYLTDYEQGHLFLCPKYYPNMERFQKKYAIESGTYVAAHVAFTKEYVISSDILGDVRFPEGIPHVPAVKSVICLPIVTNVKENCIGVIELYRECSEKPYDLINLQICNALVAWMGIAIEQNAERLQVVKEMEIQKEILHLVELYFSGVAPFALTVSDVLRVFKSTVGVEKVGFHLFKDPVPENCNSILLADTYEERIDESNATALYKKTTNTRFVPNQPGVPGYAARSGEIINIVDAYKDNRFDKKADGILYRTRSFAAFPVKDKNGVLAVLALKNILEHPHFRKEDVEMVRSLLQPVKLLCEYHNLNEAHGKMELKLDVAEKLLDFHTKPSADELSEMKSYFQGEPQFPQNFMTFEWETTNFEDDLLKYSIHIFLLPDILESCFEVQYLGDFLLRVKKSHRPQLYHNFEHAFSVLHFVVNVIMRIGQGFSAAETVALMLAAVCHDVDHLGLTNTFLSLQNDTIYKLHGIFCGELHRYEWVLFLIQQTDLLSNVSSQNFELICSNLKNLMLGFDLAIHFQNRQKIIRLINERAFDWENPEHRLLSQNMILICADHCENFKSFEICRKFTTLLCKELFRQGDLEKSMGFSPLPMLDRTKIDLLPENQVIFLSVVLVPVAEILEQIFPELSDLQDALSNTISEWALMIQSRGKAMWRIQEALPREKKDRKNSHRITISSTLSSIKTVISAIRNTSKS